MLEFQQVLSEKHKKKKKGKDFKIIRIINHYYELDSSNSRRSKLNLTE